METIRQDTSAEQLGILRLAADNEESTRRFYTGAAARLKSSAALKLVASLAAEESVHQSIIAEQIRSLEIGAGWTVTAPTPSEGRELPSRVRALERELKPDDSEQDVILYALRLEMNSHSFYHDAAQSAPNQAARDLYLRLAAMERQHFETLTLAYEDMVRLAPQTNGG